MRAIIFICILLFGFSHLCVKNSDCPLVGKNEVHMLCNVETSQCYTQADENDDCPNLTIYNPRLSFTSGSKVCSLVNTWAESSNGCWECSGNEGRYPCIKCLIGTGAKTGLPCLPTNSGIICTPPTIALTQPNNSTIFICSPNVFNCCPDIRCGVENDVGRKKGSCYYTFNNYVKCEMFTYQKCRSNFGKWGGDNLKCDVVKYLKLKTGKCCRNGLCSLETKRKCLFLKGLWGGLKTDCKSKCNSACSMLGCCCKNDPRRGNLALQMTKEACAKINGAFAGVGFNCNKNSCNDLGGGCCKKGEYTFQTQSQCSESGGHYFGNGSYLPTGNCNSVVYPCCYSNSGISSCTAITQAGCNSMNGNFMIGASYDNSTAVTLGASINYSGPAYKCLFNTCGTPSYTSCCSSKNSTCYETTAVKCLENGDVSNGIGSSCNPASCSSFGCCCIAGVSTMLTIAGCVFSGGLFLGSGVLCPATGAC